MTDLKSFKYKNTPVYVRRWYYGNVPLGLQKTCFCCNKKINNETVVLLVNNYEKFPNIILHNKCYEQWEDKTDVLCDDIAEAYADYKKLNGIFGNWIDDGECLI